ncbi:Flp pilus assembly protein RcpC/CpaB [Vibrio astriarenae]|nr:Flp pilus assembly protein RcpC/CpaB [Vibrio sp. C7]
MRTKLASLIAILAIGIGIYGIYNNLNSKNEPVQNAVIEAEPQYVMVWRTTSDIPRGHPIDTGQVKREQILRNYALDQGVRSDVDLDFTPSTLLKRDIKKGELVLPEDQAKKSDPGYIDLLIGEGMEPYPLLVSRSNLVTGYIRPGIHVDILAVSSPKENLAGDSSKVIDFSGVNAKILLNGVKVLGIEEEGAEESEQISLKATSNSRDERRIAVVLEVRPHDIAMLSLAEKTMHLEVYRANSHDEPVYADVRNVIDNYSGVMELRGSSRQSTQGGEL